MRKNILVILAFSTMSLCMFASCSKKAVVPPKQNDRSAATVKPGTSTGSTATNQPSTTHTCGGGGGNYGGSGSSDTGAH